MGQIIVNVPDCGVSSTSGNGVITVDTSNCSAPAAEIPPLVPWYAFLLGAVVLITALVSVGMVRFRRHERLEAEHRAQLNAEVDMVRNTRHCGVCGADFVPEVKG